MNSNTFKLLKSIVIVILFIVAACDEKKPEISAKDHLDLARLYFKQGSFKASVIEGKNALKLEPDNIETLTTMASVLLRLSDFSGATALTLKAIKLNEDNHNTKLLLVKIYLTQGNKTAAQTTFRRIKPNKIINLSEYQKIKADLLFSSNERKKAKDWYLKSYNTDNKNLDAIIGAAKTSLLLEQPKELHKYTALAIELFPNSIDALLWQAQIHMLNKKYPDAENSLSRAMIELERYDILTVNKYKVISMLSKALVAQGKIEESFIYSNYLAQSQPGQVQASYKRALELISKGGDIAEAEQAFQNILNQAPRHKSSGIILGLINYEKGNYEQAESYLSKFSNDENAPLRSKKILALSRIRLNRLDSAIEFIQKNIELNNQDADLYALLGYAYLKKKEPLQSINVLKKAIKLSNNNSIFYINIAKAYIANKEFKQAIISAKKALKINTNSEQAKQALISAYFYNKDFKSAKSLISKWVIESPKSTTALMISASYEQQNKNYKIAKNQFEKIITIDPFNITANMNLLKYDLKEGNIDHAFSRLSRVLNKNPENPFILKTIYNLSTQHSSTDKAIQTLSSSLLLHPLAINPRLTLAQVYLQRNEYIKSLSVINDVTKLDNKNINAYSLKAKLQLLMKNINEAKNTYLLLATLQPEKPIAYTKLAQIALNLNNNKQANSYANKALAINHNYLPAHLVLFSIAMKRNNENEIMGIIKKVSQITQDSYISYEMKADYYLHINNNKLAIKNLLTAWGKQKDSNIANKLMLAYRENQQTEHALDAWRELSKINEDNTKIQITFALILQQAKKYSEAARILEKQLRNNSNNPILLNNLANIYLTTDNKKALNIAIKALSIAPNNPAIQDTVGWIYIKQYNNYEKALPLLQQAYKLSQDQTIKQHLINALTVLNKKAELTQLEE